MEFLRWLKQGAPHRKRAPRHRSAGMVAYYWDGGVPRERLVRDISLTGAYVCATESWYRGTILTIMFKQGAGENEAVGGAQSCISIPCKVVRQDTDGGIGVKFMFAGNEHRKSLETFMKDVVQRTRAERNPGSAKGQALVEFALIVPLLFLLIVGLVDFGGLVFSWITVAHAARSGAQYAVLGGAWLGYPATPTSTKLSNLITSEMAGLPNNASVTLTVCEYNNGNLARTVSGTCASTFTTDPEAINSGSTTPVYSLMTVDVTYTYPPFVTAFNFPRLGINLPAFFGSNITVHRQAVMRVVQ